MRNMFRLKYKKNLLRFLQIYQYSIKSDLYLSKVCQINIFVRVTTPSIVKFKFILYVFTQDQVLIL